MTTITWASGVGGDWSDAADWSPKQIPGGGDTAEIGPGIAAGPSFTVTATNEMAAAVLVTAGTLSLGGVFLASGPVTVAGGAVALQASASLATSGALTLGQTGASASSGTLDDASAGLVAALSLALYDGSTLALNGGAVALGNASGTAGSVAVGANTSLTGDAGTIAGNVVDSGQIDVVAIQPGEIPGGLTITGTLTGTGLAQVGGGASLSVGGNLTLGNPNLPGDSASLTIDAGAALTVGGTLAFAGAMFSDAGIIQAGQFNVFGPVVLDGGTLVQTGAGASTIESGNVTLTGGARLSASQLIVGAVMQTTTTLALAPGTGADTLAVAGQLTIGQDGGIDAIVTGATGMLMVGGSDRASAAGLTLLYGSTVSLSAGGAITLGTGTPIAGSVLVGSDATLAADASKIDANVLLDGTLIESPDAGVSFSGNFALATTLGTLTGQGVIDVLDGLGTSLNVREPTFSVSSTLEVANAQAFTGNVMIENGCLLILDSLAMPGALIATRTTVLTPAPTSTSATVDLRAVTYEAFNLPLYNSTTGLLTVGGATLDVGLGHRQSDFAAAPDSNTGTDVTIAVACFAEGTRIRGARGAVAVEALAAGDRVVTQGGALRPVRWVGWRHIDCRRHPRPERVMPVRIAAGAFGPGRPERDLLLSPDHAVCLDGALVPARLLIDGASVTQVERDRVTYWHVELDRHDVILAEGLPCESFLDTGNRAAFANGGAVVQMHPDFAARLWDADSCAPLVVAGRALERVRNGARRG